MAANREPSITLTRDDHERLSKLAELRRGVAAADYLAYELDRARIAPKDGEAPATVRVGSRVRFRDLEADEEREVVLVMPNDADIGKGLVSVLSPVGAALVGLAAGQVISFVVPGGRSRSLQVAEITPPREEGRKGAKSETRDVISTSQRNPDRVNAS